MGTEEKITRLTARLLLHKLTHVVFPGFHHGGQVLPPDFYSIS